MDTLDARGKPRFQTVNDEESRTIQSDSHEANIKTILGRHGVSGVIEHMGETELQFGDISEIDDYADAMHRVNEANERFMRLPAKVREAFDNDPAVWLDAVHDGLSEAQRARLIKHGFIEEEVVPDPTPAISDTPPVSDGGDN